MLLKIVKEKYIFLKGVLRFVINGAIAVRLSIYDK